MTAAEVTKALERYEDALRRRGAAVVPNLRPGISETELRELERQHHLELPEDAAAVWRWHNGVDGIAGTPNSAHAHRLGPYKLFADLAFSLDFAARFIALSIEGNPQYSPHRGIRAVSLFTDNVGFMIDITPGHGAVTFLNEPSQRALDEFPVMPVAERVDWWTWAIENGAWTIDEHGGWGIDWAKYPPAPNNNTF
jgi:hypothetical protein